MKNYIYTTKDSDGIYGMLAMSAHKHFMAEQIKAFYKKVGQYVPVEWVIIGEYDTLNGVLVPYEKPEIFDYEKQLSDDLKNDTSDSIETSSIAREIEELKNE